MAFDFAQLATPQSVLGLALFLLTAWFLGEALAGKKADAVAKISIGLATAPLVPGTLLLLLNLILKMPISTPVVYVVFILVALASKAKTDGRFSPYGLKP